MTKTRSTPTSFTVRLGHPVLIFFWSVWMLLLGCVIGMHWHQSRGVAFCISVACAVMIVVHEMIDGWVWCTLTVWLIQRRQGQRERSIE